MCSCIPPACFSPTPAKQLMFIARSKEVLLALSLQLIQTFFFEKPLRMQWSILHVCYLATTWNPAILVNYPGRFFQCPSYMYEGCPAWCRTRALCLIHYYFSCCNHIGQITGWLTYGHGWAWTGSSTIQKPVATHMMQLSRLRLVLDWLKHNRSCSKCNWGVFCSGNMSHR